MSHTSVQTSVATYARTLADLSALEQEERRRSLLELTDLPPVYRPITQPSRYKGLHGGRGSAKSWAFADLLLSRCLQSRVRAVCVREHQVSLEQSVKRLLQDRIDFYKMNSKFRVLNTHIETPYDGIIIFQGMKDHTATSIKSLEGYGIAWVEEAQNFSENSLTLLRPTIRTSGSELWFSWNPENPTDPVDAFLRSEHRPQNAIVIGTTFRDNPYFPEELRIEMEWDRIHDNEKYEHIWEGDYQKHSEARVFKNWRIEEFETPSDVVFYYGGDWGYSIDPVVLVRSWLKGRTLYIDHEAFQIGCEIDHIPTLFDKVPGSRDWEIRADSARPETISYLNRHGGHPKPNGGLTPRASHAQIIPATKGPNSVKEGIIFLQGFDIRVHPRCKHTIDELRHYSFKKDPLTGSVTPILQDKKNHVIDSLRYSVEKIRAMEKGGAMAGCGTW